MKILPVPEVQKPNNFLQKELDFYRNQPKKKKIPCNSNSTVVHLHQRKIQIGYENLGPNKVPKLTHERAKELIHFFNNL